MHVGVLSFSIVFQKLQKDVAPALALVAGQQTLEKQRPSPAHFKALDPSAAGSAEGRLTPVSSALSTSWA